MVKTAVRVWVRTRRPSQLAITPWPYADLYPEIEPYIATRDYRRYNLVEPVIKPLAMSMEEIPRELHVAGGRAATHAAQEHRPNADAAGTSSGRAMRDETHRRAGSRVR